MAFSNIKLQDWINETNALADRLRAQKTQENNTNTGAQSNSAPSVVKPGAIKSAIKTEAEKLGNALVGTAEGVGRVGDAFRGKTSSSAPIIQKPGIKRVNDGPVAVDDSNPVKRPTTSGGFYSLPDDLGARSRALGAEAAKADIAWRKQSGILMRHENDIKYYGNEVSRIDGDLNRLYSDFQASPSDEIYLNYQKAYAARMEAANNLYASELKYGDALTSAEPVYKEYISAVGKYNDYSEAQSRRYNAWKSTVRDTDAIDAELKEKKAAYYAAKKASDKAIKNSDEYVRLSEEADEYRGLAQNYYSLMVNTQVMTGVPEYDEKIAAQDEENRRLYDYYTSETKRVEAKMQNLLDEPFSAEAYELELLEDEKEWSEMFAYDKYRDAPDWKEKSKAKMEYAYENFNYAYINDMDFMEDNVGGEVAARAWLGDSEEGGNSSLKKYSFMSADEVALYNYIYSTQGQDAAEKYVDVWLARDYNKYFSSLNQRYGTYRGENADNFFEKTGIAIQSGLDQFGTGIKQLFYKDALPTSAVRYAYAEMTKDMGAFEKGFYDIVSTTSNQLPSILLSTVTSGIGSALGWSAKFVNIAGTIAGTGSMGLSAAGNAYNEKVKQGYDPNQARLYAAFIGASEAGLQYLIGGISKLGGNVSGKLFAEKIAALDSVYARVAANLGANMLSEGIEEGLQEILEPIFSSVIFNEEYTPAEFGDIAYSFILGALSSGILEGADVAITEIGKAENGAAIKELGNDAVDALIKAGEKADPDTVSHRLAEKLKANRDNGENISAYELGTLCAEIEEQINEDRENALKEHKADIEAMRERAKDKNLTWLREQESTWKTPSREAFNRLELSRNVNQLLRYSAGNESRSRSRRIDMTYDEVVAAVNAADNDTRKSGIYYGVKEENIEAAEVLSNVFGKRIVFGDDSNVNNNGYYDKVKNEIWLNANSERIVDKTIAHEAGHSSELSDFYKQVQTMVTSLYGEDISGQREYIKDLYEKNGHSLKSDLDADYEIVAEFIENHLLTNKEDIVKFVSTHRTAGRNFLDWTNRTLAKLGNKSATARSALNQIRNAYMDAIASPNARSESALSEAYSSFGEKVLNAQTSFTEDTARAAEAKAAEERSRAYANAKPDGRILDLINKVKSKIFKANDSVEITTVSKRAAEAIEKIYGINLEGYKVVLEARQVEHIIKRHGESGTANRSMANDADLAKIAFVLENFTDVRNGGKTRAYIHHVNGGLKSADTVVYEYKNAADGKSYYAVETAVDTSKKTLHIVSAFMGVEGYKNEASQTADAHKAPDATSETETVKTSTPNVAQPEADVNRKLKMTEDGKIMFPTAEEAGKPHVLPTAEELGGEMAGAKTKKASPTGNENSFDGEHTGNEQKTFAEHNEMYTDPQIRELRDALRNGEITEEEFDDLYDNYYRGGSEGQYSISYDEKNKPFVVITDDILQGVPPKQWAKVVKDNLSKKFPNGVTVGNNVIKINAQTKNELTTSEYSKRIRDKLPSVYTDKLRATNNLDEVLYASRGWVGESPKHTRSDNITEFARGNVTLRVGGNDYTADVIVGTTIGNNMVLYDIVNIDPTTIKSRAQTATTSENGMSDRTLAPDSENSISSSDSNYNPAGEDVTQMQHSVTSDEDSGRQYSFAGVTDDGVEVYETSAEVRKMPYKQRMKTFMNIMRDQYRGRTAKFTVNGEVYYAGFDINDLRKNIYGDKKSSPNGRRAKINTGADGSIFELVENAKYDYGSSERGKTTAAHKGVNGWDYFVKTVQIDGVVYDLLANVRKKPDGEYVYSIQLNENKNKAPALPLQYQNGTAEAENRPVRMLTDADKTISQDTSAVNPIGEDVTQMQHSVTSDEDSGRQYSIGKTTDNKPFVEVEQDILAGVPESEWVATVKDNLKKKFPNGIMVGNNEIHIDGQSRREMTFSRYMQWLYNNDPQLQADKLRATNNADEILYATTDWVNEGLKHPRKDLIADFARGTVLLRVCGNDYTADVVVGTRRNGSMVMYDVLNLRPTSFTKKRRDAAISTNPSPGAARSTASVSESSVSQNASNYNPAGEDVTQMQHSVTDNRTEEQHRDVVANLRKYLAGEMTKRELGRSINSIDGKTDEGTQIPRLKTFAEIDGEKIYNKAHKAGMSVDEYLRENWELYDVDGEWDASAREALRLEGGNKQYSVSGIKPNMDEGERADILRRKTITPAVYTDSDKITADLIEGLKQAYILNSKDVFKLIGTKCSIFRDNYTNADVGIEFRYSRRSLDESAQKQSERVSDAETFGKMLTVLPEIISGASEIEAHTDKYIGTIRADENLKEMHVLLGAFRDGDSIVPVQLEIKEFNEKSKKTNKLYVTVTMETKEAGIKRTVLASSSETTSARTPASDVSIAELVGIVKDQSGDLFKYIPDSMLDAEQLETKRAAEVKERKRLDSMRQSGGQYSISEIEGENGNYGEGVLLDTNLFDDTKPRNWGRVLSKFVYNNLAGKQLAVYDENGNAETVNLARASDRVTKDGAKNSHRVIDKLARYNGNNIRALATVHLDEALLTSSYRNTVDGNSHQWLDTNGWEYRKVYLQDKDGIIYEATLNIARGTDRDILYDINNIRRIDKKVASGGVVPSARNNGRGSLTSRGNAESVSQNASNYNPAGEGVTQMQHSVTDNRTSDEGKPLVRDTLTKKELDYLKRAERNFLPRMVESLGINKFANNEKVKNVVTELSNEYLENGTISQETTDRLFETAYAEGTIIEEEFYNKYKNVKDYLRKAPLTLAEDIRSDVWGVGEWGKFRKEAFGALKLVNSGGNKVDTVYDELNGQYPELFPSEITHPAAQLVRMFEAVKSIQKIEHSLSYYETDPNFDKTVARNDFNATVNELVSKLKDINRKVADLTKEKLAPITTMDDIKKAYANLKSARKAAVKADALNLLTDDDNIQVGRLLRGEIKPEHLNPETDNISGILEVYRAKQGYDMLAGAIREWNERRRADLAAIADKHLETANKWKDKKAGILYSREIMERNFEDIIPDKQVAADIIREYFKPVDDSAAAANRMKDAYRDRVRELKLSTKESEKMREEGKVSEAHAVQLLGEATDNIRMLEENRRLKTRDGKTLDEWRTAVEEMWRLNPQLDQAKIRNAVQVFREIYNELFEKMNDVRIRNGYEPVNYRNGYFPHFQPRTEGLLSIFGGLLNFNLDMDALPTQINGRTYTFKPGIQWFGNALERLGFETAYDAVEGFDRYIEGCSNVIHQTDNIQKLRALAKQVRYRTTTDGIRARVDEVMTNQELAPQDKETRIKEIYENGTFELSNLAVELDEYTNLLANKKSRLDRTMEGLVGRAAYKVCKAIESRVAANMVAGNLASALTNFIPLTQATGTTKTRYIIEGMWQSLNAMVHGDDGMIERSTFLTNRHGSDSLVQTNSIRVAEILSKPMDLIDSFTSEAIVRARYMQNIKQGMSEQSAIDEADLYTKKLMAGRSQGAMPTLFASVNPLTKIFTQFQLEVNNQFSVVLKDIPRELKEKGIGAIALALLRFFLGAFLFNDLYELLVGRRPALDPIGMLNETVGDLTGYELPNLFGTDYTEFFEGDFSQFKTEKVGLDRAGVNLFKNVAEELPFVGGLIGGGRVPISSAIPGIENLWHSIANKNWSAGKKREVLLKELGKVPLYVMLPYGGGQLKKVFEGVSAAIEGGDYVTNTNGDKVLRYPIYNDDGLEFAFSALKGTLFGKTSFKTAQDWVDSGFKNFSVNETLAYEGMKRVKANEDNAYDLIMALRKADSEEEKRGIILESDVSGDAKCVAYYTLLAKDSEKKKLDLLEDVGANMGEAVKVMIGMKSARKGYEKMSVIGLSDLNDDAKIVLMSEYLSPAQYAKYTEATDAGIGVKEYCEYFEDKESYSGSERREKIVKRIDEMNITPAQKDILYLQEYSESTLNKTPWH